MNGARLADLQSASLRQNFNSRAVPTMTPDKFNRGFVRGNTEIDISVSLAIQKTLSRPKLDGIDYENNDVAITFVVGADLYTATGVFPKDVSDSAGGVGQEAQSAFNFGATKVIDAVGNSSLFNLSL